MIVVVMTVVMVMAVIVVMMIVVVIMPVVVMVVVVIAIRPVDMLVLVLEIIVLRAEQLLDRHPLFVDLCELQREIDNLVFEDRRPKLEHRAGIVLIELDNLAFLAGI